MTYPLSGSGPLSKPYYVLSAIFLTIKVWIRDGTDRSLISEAAVTLVLVLTRVTRHHLASAGAKYCKPVVAAPTCPSQ